MDKSGDVLRMEQRTSLLLYKSLRCISNSFEASLEVFDCLFTFLSLNSQPLQNLLVGGTVHPRN